MSLTEEDRRRRLGAKRIHERLRLVAGTLNAVAITSFGAAVVLPVIQHASAAPFLVWIPLALGLHLSAHVVLHFLRSED